MVRDNLEVRVSAKGAITMDFRYYRAGKVHRINICRFGHHNDILPKGAVELANKHYQKARSVHGMGHDLVAAIAEMEEQDAEHEQMLANRPRIRDAAAKYLEYFMAEKSSWRSERRYLDLIVAEMGDRDPRLIRRHHLQALIDNHRVKTPTTARHLAKCLSRFFGWMSRRGWIDSREQARDLDKPAQRVRTRVLSDGELHTLLGPDCPLPVLATFYNPLRASEICRLEWDKVDVMSGDHWVSVMVKGDKLFRTYLSPQFMRCVKTSEGFLFRGRHGMANGKPMLPNSLSELMRTHRDAVGITEKGIGVHDARTAFFTWAEGAGISERAADGVLAHARQGIMRHYGHSELADLKKDALTRWAKHLDKVRKG